MSEPIQPIPISNSNQIPERYQSILDALSEYHAKLLDKTHSEQKPSLLNDIKSILDKKASELIYCLQFNKNSSDDNELQSCITKLRNLNTPYDAETAINIEYWCDIMFRKYPFSVNPTHIQNLLKNSTRAIEEDADKKGDKKW